MILETEHIKNVLTTYFKNKPVKKVWLFGSYARGEADEESDVDVLVDFDDNRKIGLRYLAWHEDIESVVKKKVQVVSNNALSKFIRPYVDADKILIYEK